MRTSPVSAEIASRLAAAAAQLSQQVETAGIQPEDADTESELRRWLDDEGPALLWAGLRVTAVPTKV